MDNQNVNSKRLLIESNYLEKDIFYELEKTFILYNQIQNFDNINNMQKQKLKKYLGRKDIIQNFIYELERQNLLKIKEVERFDGSIEFTLVFDFSNL